MPRIAIVTDSTADLDRETLAEQHIEIVPLGLRIGQDVFLDQLDIDAKEFIRTA